MAKRRLYKKPKNGETIKVTARQLHRLFVKHEGILTSHEYGDLKNMELIDPNIRDAKWALKEFDDNFYKNVGYI